MKKFSIAKYQKELAKIRRMRKENPSTVIHFFITTEYFEPEIKPYSASNTDRYTNSYFDWKTRRDNIHPDLVYFIDTPDHLFVED
jgi:hypothetical protein